MLFAQRSVNPIVSLGLIVAALGVGSGAFFVGTGSTAAVGRSVVITSPKPGDVVAAEEPVPIEVALNGGSLATSASARDGGHLHVFVDGEVVAMPNSLQPTVELAPGKHRLKVEYVAQDHTRLDPPVEDEIELVARSRPVPKT